MKCRLHHVPGYHNTHSPDGQELSSVEGFTYPDPTIKEEVYVGKVYKWALKLSFVN